MTTLDIDSEFNLELTITQLRVDYAAGLVNRVTVERAEGKQRTLDQNALFQHWARQYAEHLLNRKPTEADHEAMKYTLQRHCYADTAFDFLITSKKDLFTGSEKPDRAPTSKLKTGEMFAFMEWVQAKAADAGLILEAKGEYADLKRGQAV